MDNVETSRGFVGGGQNPQRLADQMADAWIALAKNGDPSTAILPAWPAYDAKTRATMVFNLQSQAVNDPSRRCVAGRAPPPWRRPKHKGMDLWPAYDPDVRQTMIFNLTTRLENDPDQIVREWWQANKPVS